MGLVEISDYFYLYPLTNRRLCVCNCCCHVQPWMGWLVNVDLLARQRKGSERLLKGFDERYNNLGNGRRLLSSLNLAICMGLFTVIAGNDVIGCYFLDGRALSPASKCELQCKHSSRVLLCPSCLQE